MVSNYKYLGITAEQQRKYLKQYILKEKKRQTEENIDETNNSEKEGR